MYNAAVTITHSLCSRMDSTAWHNVADVLKLSIVASRARQRASSRTLGKETIAITVRLSLAKRIESKILLSLHRARRSWYVEAVEVAEIPYSFQLYRYLFRHVLSDILFCLSCEIQHNWQENRKRGWQWRSLT